MPALCLLLSVRLEAPDPWGSECPALCAAVRLWALYSPRGAVKRLVLPGPWKDQSALGHVTAEPLVSRGADLSAVNSGLCDLSPTVRQLIKMLFELSAQ